MNVLLFAVIIFVHLSDLNCDISLPLVINTWGFSNATESAWEALQSHGGGNSYIEALVEGCSRCERDQCDGTVGFGGSPNENGETTLDAMIFDGVNMNMGAVAAMRRIKDAIAVASYVLTHTMHSLLVGEEATKFAKQMNFSEEDLSTEQSRSMWQQWRYENSCQPNYWLNVEPDSQKQCGPYKPLPPNSIHYNHHVSPVSHSRVIEGNHDTIGMIVVDREGNIAAGTSTNGMKWKVPGRVGDSALPGAGAYADQKGGGAAVATGDGDILMRFLPSMLAVERIRQHAATAPEAARYAINRIREYYPAFFGAVVVVSTGAGGTGNYTYGAACNGIPGGVFPFSVRHSTMEAAEVQTVLCTMN